MYSLLLLRSTTLKQKQYDNWTDKKTNVGEGGLTIKSEYFEDIL